MRSKRNLIRKRPFMNLIHAKDYDQMSRIAAGLIAAQVNRKPNSLLGFATGSSPIGTYKQLIEMCKRGDVDFSRVSTVNLDEYVGLPGDHPQSYARFMREKESLRPIGNARLLQSMVGDVSVQTVPPTMLVRAAGRQWSVPRRCIGRRVTVVAMPGGQVRVRMGGEEVAVHDAAEAAGPIVYRGEHYMEALDGKRWADGDIRAAARANLDLLDALGGGGGE